MKDGKVKTGNVASISHRRTGNFFARGVGEPFAQKILASCPNFYETVENERGSYDALTWAPTHEVKMIRHMNLPYSS